MNGVYKIYRQSIITIIHLFRIVEDCYSYYILFIFQLHFFKCQKIFRCQVKILLKCKNKKEIKSEYTKYILKNIYTKNILKIYIFCIF